jgi:hypothetical protein
LRVVLKEWEFDRASDFRQGPPILKSGSQAIQLSLPSASSDPSVLHRQLQTCSEKMPTTTVSIAVRVYPANELPEKR